MRNNNKIKLTERYSLQKATPHYLNFVLIILFINESLFIIGIKVIKFYGWEIPFQNLVDTIRESEMKYYSYNAYYGIISSFTWASAPFLVAGVSFATFVLTSKDNVLDPGTAFVSLTIFYLIRFPLAMLPTTISLIVQVKARRFSKRISSVVLLFYCLLEQFCEV